MNAHENTADQIRRDSYKDQRQDHWKEVINVILLIIEYKITYKDSAADNTYLTNKHESGSNIVERGKPNRITNDSIEGIMGSITEGLTWNTGHDISLLVQKPNKPFKAIQITGTTGTHKPNTGIGLVVCFVLDLVMDESSQYPDDPDEREDDGPEGNGA